MRAIKKKILKNEFKRLLQGREFWISLSVGIVISIWHFFQYVYGTESVELDYPANIYVKWIGADAYAMHSVWFFLVVPLLSCFAFAGTFFEDMKSGYIRQIMLRGSHKAYFGVKIIVIFLSGGLCSSIPLGINLFLSATVLPALKPDLYIGIGPSAYCIGSQWYYLHPFVYALVYILFDFLICGWYSLLAMAFCFIVNYKFVALMIPFGVNYFLYCFGGLIGCYFFSPNYFMIPGLGIESIWTIVFVVIGALCIMLFLVEKGKNYEN